MTKNKKMVIIIISVLIAIVWIVGGFLLFKYLNRPKTGTEMAQKSLSQIANDMKDDFKISIGGDKQVYSLEPTPYIYNEEKMPGYVFYLNESSENSKDLNKLKEKISSGQCDSEYAYMGLFGNAKLNDRISADMHYSDLCNEIGEFDCSDINSAGEYSYETEVDGKRTCFTFKADDKTKKDVPDGEEVEKEYLEKINPKIHAIIVFPDDTASSDGDDEILKSKISELADEYGVASYDENDISVTGTGFDANQPDREGLVSAKITDLDSDGTNELIVVRMTGEDISFESENLEIEVFFIENGEAKSAGTEKVFTGNIATLKQIDSFIYNIKDKNYIFVEGDYARYQAGGARTSYYAFSFQNKKLNKELLLELVEELGQYYGWTETTWDNGVKNENYIYKSENNTSTGKQSVTGKYKDSKHPEVDYLLDFGLPNPTGKFKETNDYNNTFFDIEHSDKIFEYVLTVNREKMDSLKSSLKDYTDLKDYDQGEKEAEESTAESTETSSTADYSDYLGSWVYVNDNNGQLDTDHAMVTSVTFNKIDGNTAEITIFKGNISKLCQIDITSVIIDDKIDFSYDKDGWENSGHGTITLNGDSIHIFSEVDSYGANARMGLVCDDTLTKE